MNALAAAREVERELSSAGVPAPRTDAELLVAHVLRTPRAALAGAEVDAADVPLLRTLVERRRSREPLQHVLGEWGFRRLVLAVDRRALVPRPETEIVVGRCLELLSSVAKPRVLDVGTGSGAIALALADELAEASVVATDAFAEALALARENAARTGLEGRLELREGDLFAGASGPFHLVVSNPPYVLEEEVADLEPEVRDHDPSQALLAAGLTERIVAAAGAVLVPGGWLVLEVGAGQAGAVAGLLAAHRYRETRVGRDLAGIERVVEGRAP